jgi:hypothetical protein
MNELVLKIIELIGKGDAEGAITYLILVTDERPLNLDEKAQILAAARQARNDIRADITEAVRDLTPKTD